MRDENFLKIQENRCLPLNLHYLVKELKKGDPIHIINSHIHNGKMIVKNFYKNNSNIFMD